MLIILLMLGSQIILFSSLVPTADAHSMWTHDRVTEEEAKNRPGLEQAFEMLREGDTLVVWRLDRLGRSLKHLIELVQELSQRKVGFKSLQESIDTTSPSGKLVFHIFGALAEFERNLIAQRTKAGLAAARARGRLGGRPKALDDKQREALVLLYNKKSIQSKKSAKSWESQGRHFTTIYDKTKQQLLVRHKSTFWCAPRLLLRC